MPTKYKTPGYPCASVPNALGKPRDYCRKDSAPRTSPPPCPAAAGCELIMMVLPGGNTESNSYADWALAGPLRIHHIRKSLSPFTSFPSSFLPFFSFLVLRSLLNKSHSPVTKRQCDNGCPLIRPEVPGHAFGYKGKGARRWGIRYHEKAVG